MKKLLLSSAMVVIAAISTASAADLSRPMYTKAPPPAPPPFSWTGFYVGLNAGGKWVTNSDQTITTSNGTTFGLSGNNDSSWIAGGQIGYNWQSPGSPWVFGLEGDIDAQDFSRSTVLGTTILPFIPGDAFSLESKWQASLRARVGYAAWERTMLYVTGGVAFAQLKGTASLVGLGSVSDDQTIVGGTFGAGLEYAFTNNISLGIEGRYTWYGDQSFNLGTVTTPPIIGAAIADRASLNTAEVMGKINFRFW
jgi:outer membrane immunogenic protein